MEGRWCKMSRIALIIDAMEPTSELCTSVFHLIVLLHCQIAPMRNLEHSLHRGDSQEGSIIEIMHSDWCRSHESSLLSAIRPVHDTIIAALRGRHLCEGVNCGRSCENGCLLLLHSVRHKQQSIRLEQHLLTLAHANLTRQRLEHVRECQTNREIEFLTGGDCVLLIQRNFKKENIAKIYDDINIYIYIR